MSMTRWRPGKCQDTYTQTCLLELGSVLCSPPDLQLVLAALRDWSMRLEGCISRNPDKVCIGETGPF